MKEVNFSAKLARGLSWLAVAIIVLLPFHAFLTVWLSSLAGHYTLLRLWKEFLLVIILAGCFYLLATDGQLRRRLFGHWLTKLIIIYTVWLMIWAFIPLARHEVSAKAMWYGLLVDLRFLVFFLTTIILAAKSRLLPDSWQKILLVPAIFVAAFAILQYWVLPYDFLRHFGYGASTISPYETINNDIHHLRVASTLRGANPLGAYLILPISALAALYLKNRSKTYSAAAFGVGLLLALEFSGSRSAWLGALLALALIIWASLKSAKARRLVGWTVAGLVVLGVLAGFALRNNTSFQDTILHTSNNSTAVVSSNQGHAAAFKNAARDIVHQPWGGGVGSAGPESVYNNHPGRIAENYFLQIGQEAGVLGMLLFIAICAGAGWLLWQDRSNPLALLLLASLLGISLVNFLSHAWTDDTLSYIWWGLAGIALSPAILTDRHKRKYAKQISKTA